MIARWASGKRALNLCRHHVATGMQIHATIRPEAYWDDDAGATAAIAAWFKRPYSPVRSDT
jgi:hypothetical protein